MRLFFSWCQEANLTLFSVGRAHLELFGRWMEETGRMRSTVARRLSTLASFYRSCEQEGLVARIPNTLNVRRPKDYESRTLGLDRNELGALLAGPGSPRDHALASLLALNGLRISEALGADIDDLDFEARAPRPQDRSQGRQAGRDPLGTPDGAFYIPERRTGPIFLGAKGERMDRCAVAAR